MKNRIVCTLIIFIMTGFLRPSPALCQGAESLEEAKLLLKEALEQKKTGKRDEALKSYEKALRTNRSILGQNDDGLLQSLKTRYDQQLAGSPDDISTLEALGFINAVGFADFEKAIEAYQKVYDLSSDEKVKTKTMVLIDRLKAQWSMVKLNATVTESRNRDERVKEWNQLEKQDSLAIVSDRIKRREDRIRDLSKSREDLETRLPQMEDKIKDMEEERDKSDLLWRTTENRMYRRKRERLESDLEVQRRTLIQEKKKLEQATAELEKLTKEAEAEQATLANSDGKGGKNKTPASDDNSDNAGANPPNDMNPPDSPSDGGSPSPGGDGSGSNPEPLPGVGSTNDPALPPGDNPDFPADKPADGSGSGSGTQWP